MPLNYEQFITAVSSGYPLLWIALILGFTELIKALYRFIARRVSVAARLRQDAREAADERLAQALSTDPVFLNIHAHSVTQDAILIALNAVGLSGTAILARLPLADVRVGAAAAAVHLLAMLFFAVQGTEMTKRYGRNLRVLTRANTIRLAAPKPPTTTPST